MWKDGIADDAIEDDVDWARLLLLSSRLIGASSHRVEAGVCRVIEWSVQDRLVRDSAHGKCAEGLRCDGNLDTSSVFAGATDL